MITRSGVSCRPDPKERSTTPSTSSRGNRRWSRRSRCPPPSTRSRRNASSRRRASWRSSTTPTCLPCSTFGVKGPATWRCCRLRTVSCSKGSSRAGAPCRCRGFIASSINSSTGWPTRTSKGCPTGAFRRGRWWWTGGIGSRCWASTSSARARRGRRREVWRRRVTSRRSRFGTSSPMSARIYTPRGSSPTTRWPVRCLSTGLQSST